MGVCVCVWVGVYIYIYIYILILSNAKSINGGHDFILGFPFFNMNVIQNLIERLM